MGQGQRGQSWVTAGLAHECASLAGTGLHRPGSGKGLTGHRGTHSEGEGDPGRPGADGGPQDIVVRRGAQEEVQEPSRMRAWLGVRRAGPMAVGVRALSAGRGYIGHM